MSFSKSLVYFTLCLLNCLEFGQSVWAREDLIPGSRYTSARVAAMGDAGLPIGDDVASGLFYNPANLGRVRKAEVEPLNFSVYANNNYINMADLNFYKVTSLNTYTPTLSKQPGQMNSVGGAVLPSFGFPGFGFGVLLQSQVAAQMNGDGTVTYKSLYQFIPTIGTGFRLFDGILRFGYSLQFVNEAVGTQTVQNNDSVSYNQGLSQGSALSHNFGLGVTLPVRYLPSLNLVVRNALNANFTSYSMVAFSTTSQGVPAMEPMSVDASFSLQPRLGQGASMNLVIEDRDLTNASGAAFIGHFALGAEIIFRDKIFLRGGWGSGYPSAGIGFKRPGSEISFAWYTEEIGDQYLSHGDTRFMLQYRLRAF